jgi:hypothetical protein
LVFNDLRNCPVIYKHTLIPKILQYPKWVVGTIGKKTKKLWLSLSGDPDGQKCWKFNHGFDSLWITTSLKLKVEKK